MTDGARTVGSKQGCQAISADVVTFPCVRVSDAANDSHPADDAPATKPLLSHSRSNDEDTEEAKMMTKTKTMRG